MANYLMDSTSTVLLFGHFTADHLMDSTSTILLLPILLLLNPQLHKNGLHWFRNTNRLSPNEYCHGDFQTLQ